MLGNVRALEHLFRRMLPPRFELIAGNSGGSSAFAVACFERAAREPAGKQVATFLQTRRHAAVLLSISALATVLFAAAVVAHDNSGMFEFLRGEAEHTIPARSQPSLTIHRPHVARYSPGVPWLGKRAVCVRLCDGAFFPADDVADEGTIAGREALCSSQCPDAATRLYLIPHGEEKIDTAVSLDGQRYSELPAAFRYSKVHDATCSCGRHRQGQDTFLALMKDLTLRRGDAVMTEKGVLVFNGMEGGMHRPADFVTLSKAGSGLAKTASAELYLVDRTAAAGEHP